KELAAMTDYSSHQLTAGEFAVMYQANGEAVTDMPEDQVKQGGQPLTLSSKVPKRSGYTFTGWNTRADGSGT
ncbi:MAG: InlB B-repeat-containing protein, partial [Clostridium sp.]